MFDVNAMTLEESFRRGVFPYAVGNVSGLADPLKVFNRMLVAVPDFDGLAAKFFAPPPDDNDEDPAAANARGLELIDTAIALEPAVLAGFKLTPLADDGSGVSTTEAMGLLADFLGWDQAKDAARQADRAARLVAEAGESQAASEPQPRPAPVADPIPTEAQPCPPKTS